MSKLYFRTGEPEGFTSKKLADKKSGYTNPIRELLQNSLDASKEAGNSKCEINIYIESIDKLAIPHIKNYERALDTAIKYHKSVGSYNHNAKQIVNVIQQELKKDKLQILMFVDNGTGMSPKILNGLISERSVKSSEGSGGSFGVGHLSPYFLSSIRYVLYASKYNDNGDIKTLFSGVPILAGFEDDDASRGATGRILANIPTNPNKPEFVFPTTYPDFVQNKMDKINTGSMVTILGLNKGWDKDANYAIVSNFFYAINKQELTVNIDHENIPVPIAIDSKDINRLLENNQDDKNARGGRILSGRDAYQAWLAVKDDNNKQKIHLNNGDEVCVYIRNNIETNSIVVLIRNGMLIARHDNMLSNAINNLRKNEDFEPFIVVINADDKQCPKLFKLIKGAENPYHNKLERNRLILKQEKQLQKLFEELCEKIQTDYLKTRNRESFNLSMPLLEIPQKAQTSGTKATQNTNTTRPRSQTPRAKPDANIPKPPTNAVKITNSGKKRPAPVIISRYLQAKSSMRMQDNGDTIDVKLNATPQQQTQQKDEVYLSMSLAQDKDNDENGGALDFVSLSIDGKDIEIANSVKAQQADTKQIKLGTLSPAKTYSIQARVKKPKNIKNISVGVALKAFLGLKQRGK